MLGSRSYGQFNDEDENDAIGASDDQVTLGFDGHANGSPQRSSVEPSVLGSSQLRETGKAGDDEMTKDRELHRLQRENDGLREEVERLRGVKKDNEELQQVVDQLKRVVVSYGFSELEVMNAKPKQGKEGVEQLRYAPRELFIIISMKFAEIAAYYLGAYIYTNYFTEELGMTDQQAGNVYAAYGFFTTFLGIGGGIAIDKLGVRKSLMIGTIASTIARFGTGWTTSSTVAVLISLSFFPLGGAFGVPVLALAIRRYSHKDNRKFAFSIFYTMLMLATLLGTMMINQIKGFFPNGTVIWGLEFSWMRLVWMASTCFTLYTVLCCFFLRDIQVIDDAPLEDMKVEPSKPAPGSAMKVLAKIIKEPRFLRLSAVSLIFCGVQMGFRHLDATFPKYMIRTYGEQAPWEVILSVNPLVTFFLAPICTTVLIRYKVGFRKALILGAFLSGISPFFLALLDSYLGAVIWIVVMSIGQAIWGPKLYEYSTMSAPTGREGLFVAITAAPIYLSSVPTGILSGWMLEHYCPKEGKRDNRTMWFWVGVSVISSPILLWIFRKKLLKKGEDKPPEQAEKDRKLSIAGDDNGKVPDVPAAADDEDIKWGGEAPMVFGNAGAAWSGFDMDPGLMDDYDSDFDDPPEDPQRSNSNEPERGPSRENVNDNMRRLSRS